MHGDRAIVVAGTPPTGAMVPDSRICHRAASARQCRVAEPGRHRLQPAAQPGAQASLTYANWPSGGHEVAAA